MNKKILAGFLSAAAIGSFWACGSGEINEPDPLTDGIVEVKFMPGGVPNAEAIQTLIEESKASCAAHAETCGNIYAAYLAEGSQPETPASSSSVEAGPVATSSAFIASSSSLVINHAISSSSVKINDTDPDPAVPTSSAAAAATGLGTCTAVNTAAGTPVTEISKNVGVKFKVSNGANSGFSVIDFAKGNFVWNLGATAAVVGEHPTGPTSAEVSFTASGAIHPQVTVTLGAGENAVTETIDCAPAWVNGEAINGCLCEPAAEIVDFSGGATAAWTVTGCASATATIDPASYEWSAPAGATGTLTGSGAAATYAFTAAETVAPTVKVGNTDNSFTTVTCKPVEGSNGPKNNYDVSTATPEQLSSLQDGVLYTITHSYPQALQLSGNANECIVEVNGESVKVGYSYSIQPAPASPTTLKPSGCGNLKVGGY